MPNTVRPPSRKEALERLIGQIECKLDLPHFRKSDLLIRALTHWSYVRDVVPDIGHNERFEFHGDQVLARSFKRYYAERVDSQPPHPRLSSVALSNAYIGVHALELGILDVALFGPAFKANLYAVPNGPSARLVAADLFEALLYAIWRDQGFPKMHEYASRVLWQHTDKIPLATLEKARGDFMWIHIEGKGFLDISIPREDRSFARMGFPNAVVTHIVSASFPDGTFVHGRGSSAERAYQQLVRKLKDGFSKSPHEQK